MSDIKVVLNRDAVREMLKSPEMEEILKEHSIPTAESCGEGYNFDTKQMPTRVISSVYTETEEAMQDNLENNTILRCLQ